jgi:hypothetical protein
MRRIQYPAVKSAAWIVKEIQSRFILRRRKVIESQFIDENAIDHLHGPGERQQKLHRVEEAQFGVSACVYEKCHENEARNESECVPFALNGQFLLIMFCCQVRLIPHFK